MLLISDHASLLSVWWSCPVFTSSAAMSGDGSVVMSLNLIWLCQYSVNFTAYLLMILLCWDDTCDWWTLSGCYSMSQSMAVHTLIRFWVSATAAGSEQPRDILGIMAHILETS